MSLECYNRSDKEPNTCLETFKIRLMLMGLIIRIDVLRYRTGCQETKSV